MKKLTGKTTRRVIARRMTGGLAAMMVAGSMTASEADVLFDADTSEASILLAQAGGEGEGEGEAAASGEGEGEGEAAAGGEGEGEGEGAANLDPDTAFLSGLGFMEGHIRAGLALYEAGDIEAAKTHMGHPIEEKYDAVAERLEALELGGLKADLEALAAATEAEEDFAEVESLFENVRGKIEEARATYTPAQQVAGLVALTRVAGDEYTVAVAGGEISNLHEYQDSWGFLRTIEAEAAQMAESDDASVAQVGAAILDEVEATNAAYGDLQGEGDYAFDPSILYGAAARMEIAGLDLPAGEGEGSAGGEGEGEGEAAAASEGEGEGEGASQ